MNVTLEKAIEIARIALEKDKLQAREVVKSEFRPKEAEEDFAKIVTPPKNFKPADKWLITIRLVQEDVLLEVIVNANTGDSMIMYRL